MFKCAPSLKKVVHTSQQNFYRFLRKQRPDGPPKSTSDQLKKRLNDLGKSEHLSPIARLVIEQNPEWLDEKNLISKKHLELKFKPRSILDSNPGQDLDAVVDRRQVVSSEIEEDPTVPVSKINCSGCGALFQCQSKLDKGFMDASKFKKLNKRELSFSICLRCELLRTRNKILETTADEFDYENMVIKNILSKPQAHVILFVDLLDIPNSIYDGWSKLIKNYPEETETTSKDIRFKPTNDIDICIIGNKFDLLPHTGPLFEKSVRECLISNCEKKGIKGKQIKHVELISAKTGYNIERVISKLFKIWNDKKDVYLLGMANAGKSVFFNQLLTSDYCRALASDAIERATTSFWPGTTLNTLKFPITNFNQAKKAMRYERLTRDLSILEGVEKQRARLYEKTLDLKHAECMGIVGSSFKPSSVNGSDEVDLDVDSSYSLNPDTGEIVEGENFDQNVDIEERRRQDARAIYNPRVFKDRAAWFHDTPGLLGANKILRLFSKQELQIINPLGVMMPRVYWMQPGQSLFVGGLIRIDLIESTENQRVLFAIMTSPALPVVNPFNTGDAESLYYKYYEQGNVLRVPYKNHEREKPLPKLAGQDFEIECIGNHKSTSDIVFSCFGWTAVTSQPGIKARVRAYTLGGEGLALRQPSLLPFVINMRKHWFRPDNSQSFKSIIYRKPTFKL